MNWFDLGLWAIGAFVVFVVCGAGLLFVLAWASDKWDSRHTGGEDERLSSAAGGIIASPLERRVMQQLRRNLDE